MHCYSAQEIRDLCSRLDKMAVQKYEVVTWDLQWPLLKFWRHVPQKIRGALGIINLALAPWSYSMNAGNDVQNLKVESDGDIVLQFVKR
ncbi:MAG: hypothetical protein AB7T49_10530 [Oligoflexales bacterium]